MINDITYQPHPQTKSDKVKTTKEFTDFVQFYDMFGTHAYHLEDMPTLSVYEFAYLKCQKKYMGSSATVRGISLSRVLFDKCIQLAGFMNDYRMSYDEWKLIIKTLLIEYERYANENV